MHTANLHFEHLTKYPNNIILIIPNISEYNQIYPCLPFPLFLARRLLK